MEPPYPAHHCGERLVAPTPRSVPDVTWVAQRQGAELTSAAASPSSEGGGGSWTGAGGGS
eukprot:3634820-Rhodomonas_salina.4